jgi:hypothetical protein
LPLLWFHPQTPRAWKIGLTIGIIVLSWILFQVALESIRMALKFLKVLQWLRDNDSIADLSIRRIAFYVRKHILVETITVILKTMKIQFKQNVLDTYLDPLYPLESARL